MRIAFLLSPGARPTSTWTTLHLLDAALALGHQAWVLHTGDEELSPDGRADVVGWKFEGESPGHEGLAAALADDARARWTLPVRSIDLLMLRHRGSNPSALSFALRAQDLGVQVVNDPVGVARTRSKAWLAGLPPDIPRPRTLVTHRLLSARVFSQQLTGPVVVKPGVGAGGSAVTLVDRAPGKARDLEIDVAFDRARTHGGGPVVLQAYLPEASEGERRLVWLDGDIIGAYLRQRRAGEFRHNLSQGATPEPCEVRRADRRLAAALHPHLQHNGIRIAGLDVIGDQLVEVNTANPGGVHWSETLQRASSGPPDPALSHQIIERITASP